MKNYYKKILVYKGDAQYDTLGVFADHCAMELENMGCCVIIIDFADVKNSSINLLSQIGEKIDAIISFNAIGVDLESQQGQFVLDYFDAPYYAYLMDHPMHHNYRLSTYLHNYNVICIDKNHLKYIEDHYKNIKTSAMIAHGGIVSDMLIPYENRKIDVLFTGSYSDPDVILEKLEQLPEDIKGMAFGVIDLMISECELTEEEAFVKYFIKYGLEELIPTIKDWMTGIVQIDQYVRNYFRYLLISTLVESGITVNVYGSGWEKFHCLHRENLIVSPPVKYNENLRIIADSKVVLNIMPGFKAGSHERIFNAMLNQSVCVTDSSSYIDEHFTDGKDIILYSIKQIQEVSKIIGSILNDSDKAKQIAMAGYANACENHTWKNRMEEFLQLI